MSRTALITGGTGGLGVAVATRFADAGWRVVAPGTSQESLDRLPAHERIHPMRADLFDPKSARGVAAVAADDTAAPLGAVVNLVGGFAMGGRVHEADIAQFEQQLHVNLRPTYLTCHAAIGHLIDAGGGAVVCVSSRAALHPFPGAAGYVTSKAAVLALVDAMAVEYADDGIRVNAVLPSTIDTPANRASMPKADHSKWVKPAEIADVIHFLCSPESGVVSGAHVPVYGRA